MASCKGIQDSLGFWIPRLGFRIPGTVFSPVFVFRIPKLRISDCTCKIIPDSGVHKQKFLGYQNPDCLTWGDMV